MACRALQVCGLIGALLPPEASLDPQRQAYMTAMLTAGSPEPMTRPQLTAAMKSCRAAYKEVRAHGGVLCACARARVSE